MYTFQQVFEYQYNIVHFNRIIIRNLKRFFKECTSIDAARIETNTMGEVRYLQNVMKIANDFNHFLANIVR